MFGLTTEEIQAHRQHHTYHPQDLCRANPRLERIVAALASNRFCPGEPGLFRWISELILGPEDVYFHLADLPEYLEVQGRVGEMFRMPSLWAEKAILNVARSGKFSSDRSIREYAREIWNIQSL